MNLILISGKAGSGKSYLASQLACESDGVSRVKPLAEELKEIALRMGWDGVKDERGRNLLIDIGTAGRAYDIDLWCKIVADRHNDPRMTYIIDDVRYPSEVDYFLRHRDRYEKIIHVRMISPEFQANIDDPSETSLDNWAFSRFDYVINNDHGEAYKDDVEALQRKERQCTDTD